MPGLGDKAMLQVAAGQEEGGIEVLKGDVDILVFGTLSGSADGYAATLRQAAAMVATHLTVSTRYASLGALAADRALLWLLRLPGT